MRTIGLIGGMSWESTIPYYRIINETVQARLGGLHSARLALVSVEFQELAERQHADDWDGAGRILADAGRALAAAGAGCLVICANTMHKVAAAAEAASGLPVLHIADVTGRAARDRGLATVGLLGTRFTMAEPFYRDRLGERFGLRTLVPDRPDQEALHGIIFDELCRGRILQPSRDFLLGLIDRLAAAGAEGVILGCTELPLLVAPEDVSLPLLDTTRLHAEAAAEWALS
jgi:aspartate racemase